MFSDLSQIQSKLDQDHDKSEESRIWGKLYFQVSHHQNTYLYKVAVKNVYFFSIIELVNISILKYVISRSMQEAKGKFKVLIFKDGAVC